MLEDARAPHTRHNQVARPELLYVITDLDDFTQTLVAEQEVIAPAGWPSIGEGTNLAISAANAHFERAYFQFVRRGDRWLGMVDQAQFLPARNNANAFHHTWWFHV